MHKGTMSPTTVHIQTTVVSLVHLLLKCAKCVFKMSGLICWKDTSTNRCMIFRWKNFWTPQTGVHQDLIAAHRANLQSTCAGRDLQSTELTRSWLLIHIVFRHPQHTWLQAVWGRWHLGPLEERLPVPSCPDADCGTVTMWARTRSWRGP